MRGEDGGWEPHVCHLHVSPSILATESLCLEQAFFAEVTRASHAGICYTSVCASQIGVVSAQCEIIMGITTALIHI